MNETDGINYEDETVQVNMEKRDKTEKEGTMKCISQFYHFHEITQIIDHGFSNI